jgi:hypothetical protein
MAFHTWLQLQKFHFPSMPYFYQILFVDFATATLDANRESMIVRTMLTDLAAYSNRDLHQTRLLLRYCDC